MIKNIEFRYWFGPEVEGRYTGLETFFVRSGFPPDDLTSMYPHCYITNNMVSIATDEDWNKCIDYITNENKIVTIEFDEGQLDLIPARLRNIAHLLLRIQSKDIAKLKSTDTVAVDAETYNCWTISKYNMQKVSNENYAVDYGFTK